MKAVLISDKILFQDVPTPKLKTNNEVLLKVKAAGLCGSDFYKISDIKQKRVKKSSILGHEIAGEVVKKGTKITNVSLGDRVVVEPLINCSQCKYCKLGSYQLCSNLKSLGKELDGGFAEYVVVPAENLFKLGNDVSYKEGVLLDSLAVCLHASNLAGGYRNKQVAVVGDGTMGVLTAKLAEYQKSKNIVLVGKNIDRLRQIISSEVSLCDSENKSLLDKVSEKFDVVIEAVGRKNNKTIDQCINLVGPGGEIIVLGVFPEGYLVKVNARKLFFKEAKIVGCNSYGYFRGSKEIQQAAKLLNSKKLGLERLITHFLPLKDFSKGLELFKNKRRSGAIKIVFHPSA